MRPQQNEANEGGGKMSEVQFDYTISTKPERKPGTKAKATIADIKEVKAVDVFKAAAKNPDQLLFVIFAKIGDWQGRVDTINKPISKQISPKSRLAQFKQRYKQFPKIGMKVDVLANDAGYWKLDL
ncbi:MAG TPA: hypothetical protein VJZ32_12685 [Candidatus Bathyarchaeia archaeon]|nr:hypothetical protein [Candidatus Bathyarchaeia archaeon]